MSLPDLKSRKVWLVVGSQHLYGEETLAKVEAQAREVAGHLAGSPAMPASLAFEGVVTTPTEILSVCKRANDDDACVGLVFWMHTFSPAKMWIAGLQALQKPFCQLNTQYAAEIPWSTIDMDYMNLNQSAHGDREFGFICSRLRIERRVVVGHWKSEGVQRQLGAWTRAAIGRDALRRARIARFGDNMRQVAVTEGDKVEAQIRLGATVDGYGLGDLVPFVDAVSDARLREEFDVVAGAYELQDGLEAGADRHGSLLDALRIELGLRDFLTEHDYQGFTDTFENLHGLKQLPGIGAQRLMADGYGFGAEGDWKTAVMLHAAKVMAQGLSGGTSFMEDYTYHLPDGGGLCLGSHMLEVCPTIAAGRPRVEVHPLGIGGKEDPARLVFTAPPGEATNVAMVDMGDRFRMICGELDVVDVPHDMPNLPTAAALWKTQPDFETGTAAWMHAGGAHHSVFSMALKTEHFRDLAEMLGIELLVIDEATTLPAFKRDIRLGEAAYS
ncbi:L-arabinose isomerase [Parvularcula dongshanensis]|uniref:L-arabinose isomerase n=1 Tax=Parvularcula dongshanensis TaxID=1173995 RepID=A0A840I777_9PROT|nr:L-arabinose isomerase [Parvularcula dongshanensis]MBB4659958.1 L-arabinose isomerase [Parvularcula dongshanensis]